jgi:hypothetical protein
MNMSNEKWKTLILSIENLSFAPAYQLKLVGQQAYPEKFDEEVVYYGDWSDECLFPYNEIEWIAIKPRVLKHVGKLVSKKINSIEEQVLSILHQQQISYKYKNGNIIIYNVR